MSKHIDEPKLSTSPSIIETLRRFPESITILNALGIDIRCGGAETLDDAARQVGIEPDALLSALDVAASAAACEIDP
jgi:iron-sulfur cluster repair protein YtfE (RIC family)